MGGESREGSGQACDRVVLTAWAGRAWHPTQGQASRRFEARTLLQNPRHGARQAATNAATLTRVVRCAAAGVELRAFLHYSPASGGEQVEGASCAWVPLGGRLHLHAADGHAGVSSSPSSLDLIGRALWTQRRGLPLNDHALQGGQGEVGHEVCTRRGARQQRKPYCWELSSLLHPYERFPHAARVCRSAQVHGAWCMYVQVGRCVCV